MDIFSKIASAQAQCPAGKIVVYDLQGRVMYVTEDKRLYWEQNGYSVAFAAPAPVAPVAPSPAVEISTTAPKVGRAKRK
jgi:hypothetical protein